MHTTTQLARCVMQDGPAHARRELAALFERVMRRIHRYFRRVIRNPSEADDALQRTLVLLHESLQSGSYDPDRSFNTWLWLKARTVYAQLCRERARRGEVPAVESAVEADVERRVDGRSLLHALSQSLGSETYEVFVLYYEGGLTQDEIGRVLDRDRKTVRKRIREAHQALDELRRD